MLPDKVPQHMSIQPLKEPPCQVPLSSTSLPVHQVLEPTRAVILPTVTMSSGKLCNTWEDYGDFEFGDIQSWDFWISKLKGTDECGIDGGLLGSWTYAEMGFRCCAVESADTLPATVGEMTCIVVVPVVECTVDILICLLIQELLWICWRRVWWTLGCVGRHAGL